MVTLMLFVSYFYSHGRQYNSSHRHNKCDNFRGDRHAGFKHPEWKAGQM